MVRSRGYNDEEGCLTRSSLIPLFLASYGSSAKIAIYSHGQETIANLVLGAYSSANRFSGKHESKLYENRLRMLLTRSHLAHSKSEFKLGTGFSDCLLSVHGFRTFAMNRSYRQYDKDKLMAMDAIRHLQHSLARSGLCRAEASR